MNDKHVTILRESSRLFVKYGIRSMSMDDLCRELGISKKTLYQYVGNKADLISQTLEYVVSQATETLKEAEQSGCNAVDQLLAVSRKISGDMHNLNPSLTFDLQKYYPEIYRKFTLRKKEIIFKEVMGNMQRGIQEGLYREDLPAELVARLYVHKLEYINDPEFLQSEEYSFPNMFQVMFDNHIRGICNPAGLKYYESKLVITDS